MESTIHRFKRKLNQRERTHNKAPNSNVSIIATIKGNVSSEKLRTVIKKMQVRHPLLNSHLKEEGKDVFLIGNGSMEIPLKVIQREGDNHWNRRIIEEHKIPLDLVNGPLIRFILLYSPEISDLIVFCQHCICDGMSLAYLIRDIMLWLEDPSKLVIPLLPPVVDEEAIPVDIKPSTAIRILGKTISKKWEKNEVIFDYNDFNEIHKVYWEKYTYKAELLQFSKEDTEAFVKVCRKHGVTVNTALISAFAIAQNEIHPEKHKYLTKFGSAANIRDFLLKPVGDSFGFFAGGIKFEYKYDENRNLWDVAKAIHQKVHPEKTRKESLTGTLDNFQMPASFMEAQFFAAFGHLILPGSPSYNKIHAFINDKKNLAIKMVKKRISKGLVLAQIMTNLGNLKFPENYGDLTLQNVILMPSCSPYTELAYGVVTHASKLNVTLNYMDSSISTKKVLEIREIAKNLITNALVK